MRTNPSSPCGEVSSSRIDFLEAAPSKRGWQAASSAAVMVSFGTLWENSLRVLSSFGHSATVGKQEKKKSGGIINIDDNMFFVRF